MATKVGDVFAQLTLRADKAEADIKSFKSELKKTTEGLDKGEKKTKKFGASLRKVGGQAKAAGGKIAKGIGVGTVAIAAAGLAAFTFAKTWAAAVDDIGKASSKFKIPAQELQSLQFAADLSGASAESLRKSIQNLNKFITEGKDKGVTPFTEALFQLGLSIDDIEGKTKTEVFGIIGDELNKLVDVEQRATLQMKLFGEEAGPQLGNFIEQGSKGIRAMVKEVEELGGTLDENALKAAADLNDEMARMKVVMGGIANFIGTRLAPVIRRIIMRFRDWVLANRDLLASKLEKFLTASADAAARLLPQFIEIATATIKIVEAVGGLEGALKLAIGGLVAFKFAFAAAFGPAGPIIAGIVALITLFGVLDSKLDQSARKVDALIDKSLTTRSLLESGEFDRSELGRTAEGRKLLDLERQKEFLVSKQKADEAEGTAARARQRTLGIRGEAGTADEFAAEDQQREIDALDANRKKIEARSKQILLIQKKIDDGTERFRTARIRAARDAQRASASDRTRDDARRAEFRKLARLAVNESATPAQLERLAQLEKDLEIERPRARKNVFALETGGAGAGGGGAAKPERKTPQQLIQEALGGGGNLGVGGLVPSGPGTTINHNNFSINLAAPDIDIIIKGLPANATAGDVAQRVKDEMRNAVQDTVRIAYQTQVQQVVG